MMEHKGHPIAGAIMLILALIPAFGNPSVLSSVIALILCGLAFRYGFWGAIWRWFLVCTIVLIPLLLIASTQLPGEQRRRLHRYY